MPSLPFQLRPFLHSDAPDIAKHLNDTDMLKGMRNYIPYPYTLADGEAFIDRCLAPTCTDLLRAITINEELVGIISLMPEGDVFSHTAKLGYWLAKPYWGQGIMTNVVKEFTELCWQQPNIIKIFANTFENNPASGRVLIKAGYQQEARLVSGIFKQGVYMDQFIFYMLRPGFPDKDDIVFAG